MLPIELMVLLILLALAVAILSAAHPKFRGYLWLSVVLICLALLLSFVPLIR